MISVNRLSNKKETGQGWNDPQLRTGIRCQRGSILIFLIVLIIIFSVLGGAMLSMYGTSTMSVFAINSARRANYLAESGLRYALSQVRNAGTLVREQALTAIDDGSNSGKWYIVEPNLAKYQVRVYPYWSKASAGTNVSTVNATVSYSGFPTDYSVPGIGTVAYLKVGTNNRVRINNIAISSNRKTVSYTLASPVTVQSGNFANLCFPTTNSNQTMTKGAANTSLSLNINSTNAIPKKNGAFFDDTTGRLYSYSSARLAGSTVQLDGVNWNTSEASVTFPANQYLVFLQAARLDAYGVYQGIQKVQTDYVTLFTAGSQLTPPSNLTPPALTSAASGFTNESSALQLTNSGNRVALQSFNVVGNVTIYGIAFQHLGEAATCYQDPEQASCNIGYHTVPVSQAISDNLRNSWMQYHRLNYDVQIKAGWDLNLKYASQGIAFRWHKNETCAAAVACPSNNPYCCYEGYGLSFMRFKDKSTCSGDMIPNTVKPGSSSTENGKLVIVLWQQKIGTGNVATKDWIAYARLGDPTNYQNPSTQRSPADPDQKVTGNQGWPDGLLNDNASIIVRVEDKIIQNVRHNEIKLFYGDASPNTFTNDSRVRDHIATNKRRGVYSPQSVNGTINPTWPTNQFGLNGSDVAYWNENATTTDYFTLLSATPTTAYSPPVTLVTNNAPRSNFGTWSLLSDHCTIRTTDFTLDNFSSGRSEIGLSAMGNLNSTNGTTVVFDDLYIQILGGY